MGVASKAESHSSSIYSKRSDATDNEFIGISPGMIYEAVIRFRNWMFDRDWLPVYTPDIPVIVVGNLVTGGTGKTPIIGWLAGKLKHSYRIAVLSRGYKRLSAGFRIVQTSSSPLESGDEPLELKLRHPDILVAVDRNRTHGIRNLASGAYGKVDLILMDDGFQHRSVKSGFSIILDDFNRPMHRERMIPAGRLREPLSALKRADMVIITKVPQEGPVPDKVSHPWSGIKPTYFSRLHYQNPVNLVSLFDHFHPGKPVRKPTTPSASILVTGIASPGHLNEHLRQSGRVLVHLKYPDHHRYTKKDIRHIIETYHRFEAEHPAILTTGKDFVKLARFAELSGMPVYRVPVVPEFESDQEKQILSTIRHYVEQAQRIGGTSENKEQDHS